MIYYMFSEKERLELEHLLINEMTVVKKLITNTELGESQGRIALRALKERRELLVNLICKISNNKEKSLEL